MDPLQDIAEVFGQDSGSLEKMYLRRKNAGGTSALDEG